MKDLSSPLAVVLKTGGGYYGLAVTLVFLEPLEGERRKTP